MLGLLAPYIGYAQQFSEMYGGALEQKWLPNFAIKDIVQDRYSNIWVATNAGLYKYNINTISHYDITSYTADKYLNNQIYSILEDDKGDMLIATQSGLGEFNTARNAISLVSAKDQTVTHIQAGNEHKYLYIVAERDIFQLVPTPEGKSYSTEVVFKSGSYQKSRIKAVIALDNNSYLIAAADGVWMFKENQLYPTAIKGMVNALYKDGNTIWVGTAFQGIYKCNITDGGLSVEGNYIPKNKFGQIEGIVGIRRFNDDEIVFATTTKVLMAHKQSFPNVGSLHEKDIFEHNSITKILVDKTMNIWIGSRNGLFSLNPLNLLIQFNSFDNSIYQDVGINALLALNDDSLLVATNNLGIQLFDTRSNKISSLKTKFKDVRILRRTNNGDLLILADNRLYTARPNQLFKLNDTKINIPQKDVNDVVEIAPGEFWFSHWHNKIVRVNFGKDNPRTNAVYNAIIKSFSSNVHLYVLEIDSKDNLWVGSRGEGLLRINLKTLKLKKFERKDKFPDQILCIKEDGKGRLWVGTRDKGLLLYQPETDSFKTFDHNNGLPSNTICAIQENSSGEIWLSTLNGLAQLSEGKIMSFKSYNKESGIYNAEFSFNISEAGKDKSLYFGTENGLYKFVKMPQKHAPTPLEWTNIDLVKGTEKNIEQTSNDDFSKKMLMQVDDSGTIVLDHNQNSLQIGFAKLDYTLPKHNFYAYRLLGYDTAWSVLQGEKSMAQYFDLPPGDYVFQVMTTDANNTWDSAPKSFALVIKPSFWQTGYALALYVVLIILLGFLVYKIVQRWRSINKKLEEEIESARIHDQQMVYYADLSHEIKNRLTLIMGPLEEALKNKKVNFQMLNRIYEQGQRLKRFSDQIMNIRKSETGDFLLTVSQENITAIISKIVDDAKPLAVVKDIDISFETPAEQVVGWCDAEIVEIIGMNVLNNAIKYCKPDGTVKISLEVAYLDGRNRPFEAINGNYLICEIADTGIGIADEDMPKVLEPFYRSKDRFDKKEIPGMGIGLDLVARLIKKHYGHLSINSVVDEFTSIVFYLPIDKTIFSINELRPDIKTQPIVIDEKNFKDVKTLILPDPSAERQEEEKPEHKKYTLLMVDDDHEMLFYLRDIFEETFNVMLASSAEEALNILNEAKIDLIVCDLDMPNMNGLTFCRVLKQDEEQARIPFLLLTGRDSEEQKLVAFENGVDDFVEKPFRSELLSWRVKSLLRNTVKTVKTRTIVVAEPTEMIKETKTERFIQEVMDLIDHNVDKQYLNVDYLADEMCMSRATFYRKMEEMFGESPSMFIRKYRLKKAIIYLQTQNYSLKQISDKVGFSNAKYFSKCFKSEFGMLPSEYLEQEESGG